MTAKVLTVQSVERHKPNPERRLEIPDATLPGFYLVVQPSGAKSWAVRYRITGAPLASSASKSRNMCSRPAIDLHPSTG